MLFERYDPHIRSRTAGQLLSLFQFDLSGDLLSKLEQASGEKISDGVCVRVFMNRVTDTELATHLWSNSERFQTWAFPRREVVDVSRAESEQRCATSPAAEIMSLEGHAAERITFGVDSGAALSVIGKDVAAEYFGVPGHARRMADC